MGPELAAALIELISSAIKYANGRVTAGEKIARMKRVSIALAAEHASDATIDQLLKSRK